MNTAPSTTPPHGTPIYLMLEQLHRLPNSSGKTYHSSLVPILLTIMLTLLAGITTIPFQMPFSFPSTVTTTVFFCNGLAALGIAQIGDLSRLFTIRNGLRIAGAVSILAGFCLVGDPIDSASRAAIFATLFLSMITGLICLTFWHDREQTLRSSTLRWPKHLIRYSWHILYGMLSLSIILVPMAFPLIISNTIGFLIIRLIPISLGMGIAIALMDQSHFPGNPSKFSERIAWFSLIIQTMLLFATTPFSLTWTISLFLTMLLIFTIGQWIFLRQQALIHQLETTQGQNQQQIEQLMKQLVEQDSRHREQRQVASVWLSLMAHDLKLPLQTILAGTSGLRRYGPDLSMEMLLMHSQAIYSSAHRLRRFLRRFLDAIDHSFDTPMQLASCPYQVFPLLQHIIEDEQTLVTNPIILINDPPPGFAGQPLDEEVIAIWDKDRIEAIILNCLQNAEKYSTPHSPIEIYIWQSSNIKEVQITIIDHGRGMSEETMSHVFEPYYRGSQELGISGDGLGLAMAYVIVQRHGGKITLNSILEQGTIFYITLPLAVPGTYNDPM
jgi:signal transduction histidine kinase